MYPLYRLNVDMFSSICSTLKLWDYSKGKVSEAFKSVMLEYLISLKVCPKCKNEKQ